MVQITRICKSFSGLAAIAALSAATPASAILADSGNIEAYAEAWVADLSDEDAKAASKYYALLRENPSDPAIADGLWESSIRAGERSKAIRAARTLELQGGANEATLLLFGDALQKKDWKGAEASLAALADGNNYSFVLPLFKSWVNVAQGKAHAFPSEPENSLLRFYSADQTAYLNLAAGDISKAKSSLSDFLNLETSYSLDLRLRAAPILAAAGEGDFAGRLVDGIIPTDIAQNLTAKRQPNGLSKLRPEEGVAALYTRLASALIEQEAPEKGLAMARIAQWLAPKNDAAKIVLARALDIDGAKGGAHLVRAAIGGKSPYWARASIAEIQRLSADGQHAEAISLAQRILAQRNSADFAALLGQTQEAAGQLEAARATFARLVKSGETARIGAGRLSEYYLQLATVTKKQGNWRAARALLEKGQALNPQNAYISNYLGYSLLERGEELNKALEMLRRAHRLAPESMAITDSLGWGYYLTGNFKNAIYYLEKAAKGSGNDLTINEHLGDAYWQYGRRVEARYAWRVASLLAKGADATRLSEKISLGLSGASRQN